MLFTIFPFWRNHYSWWSPAFQEEVEHRTSLADGKWKINNFSLCLCAYELHFSFNKLPYLNLWLVFHLIFPPLFSCELVEKLSGHLVASQGQHTTLV